MYTALHVHVHTTYNTTITWNIHSSTTCTQHYMYTTLHVYKNNMENTQQYYMYTTLHVYNTTCTQHYMYATLRVCNTTCTQHYVYATLRVRNTMCTQHYMYTTLHVYNTTCIQHYVYIFIVYHASPSTNYSVWYCKMYCNDVHNQLFQQTTMITVMHVRQEYIK